MDPNLITIRAYQPNDYQGLVGVLKEVGLYDEALDTELTYSNKVMVKPKSIWVAVKNGEVIGAVVAVPEWGASISRLAVKKRYRGQEIEEALIMQAEESLRKDYQTEARVYVEERNREEKKFYETQGYRAGNNYRVYTKKL